MNEPMDDVLRRAAADYHTPPATPREEMWARIRAELEDAAPDAATRRRGDAAKILPLRSRPRDWLPWGVGLAAMLALGIGIGRMLPETSETRVAQAPAPVGETEAASTQGPEQAAPDDVARSTQLANVEAAPESAAAETTSPRRRVATSPRPEGSQRLAAADRPAETATPSRGSGAQIYRFAAGATLSQAEALLTAYRADVAAGRLHPQIETWARDVLSTTRLLLDSPAAQDPRLRTLLEDLELVLAQLVQLGGDPAAEELDLLEQTMEQRDMLPRLRTGIPAAQAVETD